MRTKFAHAPMPALRRIRIAQPPLVVLSLRVLTAAPDHRLSTEPGAPTINALVLQRGHLLGSSQVRNLLLNQCVP